MEKENSALNSQEGGDHYKKLGHYQPWEVLSRWLTPQELKGFAKGTVIAYLAREEDKGGRLDIKKAMHTLQLYLELSEEPMEETAEVSADTAAAYFFDQDAPEVLKEKEALKIRLSDLEATCEDAITSAMRAINESTSWSGTEYSTVEQEVSEFLPEEERGRLGTEHSFTKQEITDDSLLDTSALCMEDPVDEELRLKAERDREAAFPADAVPPRSRVTSVGEYDGSDFW